MKVNRFFSFILVVVFAVTLLAGCGSGNGGGQTTAAVSADTGTTAAPSGTQEDLGSKVSKDPHYTDLPLF